MEAAQSPQAQPDTATIHTTLPVRHHVDTPPRPADGDLAARSPARRWVAGVFVATLALYLLFVPRIVRFSSPPTGDQPFYLMDAISLVQDGDIELSNNYAAHDEEKFYALAPHPDDFVGMSAPDPLPPQLAVAIARPPEEFYSYHPPGLGILLVPAWIVGSWLALWWPATVVWMCIVGALVATNVFLLAYETSGRLRVALAVWAALAFCGPLMSYSYLIFSELPAALLVIYAFRRLALGWRANNRWRILVVGLCIGYIPLLAVRCAPIAAALFAYAAVQCWRSHNSPAPAAALRIIRAQLARSPLVSLRSRALVLAGPVLLFAALLGAYHIFLNGTIMPPPDEREGGGVGFFYWPWLGGHNLYLFLNGAFGLLYSQRFGLLIFAPIYLFAPVGAVALWRSGRSGDRRLLIWIALVALPYMAFIAAYSGWGGDWGPPARYAATLLPLLAAPIAQALVALRTRRAALALYGLFAMIGYLFMAVMLNDPRTMFSGSLSAILTWIAENPLSPVRWDLRPLVPSFVASDEEWFPWRSGWLLAFSIAVVVGLVLLLPRPTPAPRERHAVRWALGLAPVVLLLAAWGVINYQFLRPKTELSFRSSWQINLPLDSAGGIAYLNGTVYIAVYGQRPPAEQPGSVVAVDLDSGYYSALQPHDGDGNELSWAHPGSVAVGPDGLLYVLNNGAGDEALLVLRPDGTLVRRVALNEKTELGMGLTFDRADESLLIADQYGGLVLRYGEEGGAPLARFSGTDSILNNPRGVGADRQGNIYTSEVFNRVQKLDEAGAVRSIYDLNCRPRYFASAITAPEWLEASCNTGIVSLNTDKDFVQLAHFSAATPRPNSPRGLAYGPPNTLYVLDGQTLYAYIVEH